MSSSNILFLILPFLGALAGIAIAKIIPFKNILGLKLILSFSGAFLLGITIFELIPEIFSTGKKQLSIFVMSGILFQILLETFSKGAEHGHVHSNGTNIFPIGLWISLCIHALLEGMPLSNQMELTYGIVIHKIPIGMILYFIVEKINISVITKWSSLLIFCLMTPLGSGLVYYTELFSNYQLEITAWVVGMILHISTTILFESSDNHTFTFKKIGIILLAIIFAFFL